MWLLIALCVLLVVVLCVLCCWWWCVASRDKEEDKEAEADVAMRIPMYTGKPIGRERIPLLHVITK